MRNLKILIAEDNPAHIKILQYVLDKNELDANYYYVRDGEEALNFLYRSGTFASKQTVPTPDIILLDLNLPKRDGREVLKIIKEDSKLKDIPVVVISTSDREEDIDCTISTGASAYISKSVDFDVFKSQIAKIIEHIK